MQSSYLCFTYWVNILLYFSILLNFNYYSLINIIIIFSKENTALRAGVDPNRIFVIPNAVDTDIFRPLSTAPNEVMPTKECMIN